MNHSKTLVLIPGLLCDRTVWTHFIALMNEHLPIYVADLTTQDSITQMAIDTLASCKGELLVAGHSMGARVAMEMVRLAPERIVKLALLDTGIHSFLLGEEIHRNQLVKLAYEDGMRALADEWLPPMVHPKRSDDSMLMEALFSMVEKMTPQIHEQQIQALINRPDATIGLDSVTCPTLVLVGQQDVWSPVDQHKEINNRIQGSKLVIIKDAGHFSLMERPDVVSSILNDWVNT